MLKHIICHMYLEYYLYLEYYYIIEVIKVIVPTSKPDYSIYEQSTIVFIVHCRYALALRKN